MPDTAENSTPVTEGGETAATQLEPQDGTEQPSNGDPWADPEVARREIEKLRREAAGYRTKYNEAKPKLTEYQQYLDSQKTEQERLNEAKLAAETKLSELVAQNARLVAAAEHGIPAELIDLLGTGTEEEIASRAKLLSEKLSAPQATRPASTRPVESLTAGGKPTGDAPADPNAAFRALFGR